MEAEREMFGEGIVEKDSERPESGNEGTGGEMEEIWGEVTGVEDGPEEANIK